MARRAVVSGPRAGRRLPLLRRARGARARRAAAGCATCPTARSRRWPRETTTRWRATSSGCAAGPLASRVDGVAEEEVGAAGLRVLRDHGMTRLSRLHPRRPGFPVAGILFRDVTPLLASPEAFAAAVARDGGALPRGAAGQDPRDRGARIPLRHGARAGARRRHRAGAQARASCRARPSACPTGSSTARTALEVHADAFRAGERVLVVDDVLATGGTAKAAAELAERLGADVIGVSVFIELEALGGRAPPRRTRRLHAVLML